MSCTTKSKGLRIHTWVIIARHLKFLNDQQLDPVLSSSLLFDLPEMDCIEMQTYHWRSFLPWCRGQFHRFKTVGGSQRNGFIHGFLATEQPYGTS